MSNQEILNLLEPFKSINWRSWEDYAYDEDEEISFSEELIELLGKPELVAQYGGLGKGDEYWNVLHFPKVNVCVRQTGFYQSYSGADMDDSVLEVVEEKEKVIKVWKAIK